MVPEYAMRGKLDQVSKCNCRDRLEWLGEEELGQIMLAALERCGPIATIGTTAQHFRDLLVSWMSVGACGKCETCLGKKAQANENVH
jgi:threonine dehydrogenase-like Zn-dependent dehydrogenase